MPTTRIGIKGRRWSTRDASRHRISLDPSPGGGLSPYITDFASMERDEQEQSAKTMLEGEKLWNLAQASPAFAEKVARYAEGQGQPELAEILRKAHRPTIPGDPSLPDLPFTDRFARIRAMENPFSDPKGAVSRTFETDTNILRAKAIAQREGHWKGEESGYRTYGTTMERLKTEAAERKARKLAEIRNSYAIGREKAILPLRRADFLERQKVASAEWERRRGLGLEDRMDLADYQADLRAQEREDRFQDFLDRMDEQTDELIVRDEMIGGQRSERKVDDEAAKTKALIERHKDLKAIDKKYAEAIAKIRSTTKGEDAKAMTDELVRRREKINAAIQEHTTAINAIRWKHESETVQPGRLDAYDKKLTVQDKHKEKNRRLTRKPGKTGKTPEERADEMAKEAVKATLKDDPQMTVEEQAEVYDKARSVWLKKFGGGTKSRLMEILEKGLSR